MTTNKKGQRALVTGRGRPDRFASGRLAVREGWRVRVLDNLEPNTHKTRQARLDQAAGGIH